MKNISGGQTERLNYYDLLRIILVILVVIGHGTYYNIITKFGGIRYLDLMSAKNVAQPVFYKVVDQFTKFIYTFHMPVFIALSGSLYALAQDRPFKTFIRLKAKRLLIPFFAVWIFWNLPIKYFTGYYDGISITGILLQMIFPASVYLWYLECLFFVFVLYYFIKKLQRNLQSIIIFFLWAIGVVLYQKFGQYHFLGDPLYYLGWFYIGYRIDDIIKFLIKCKVWNIVPMLVLIIVDVALFYLNQHVGIKLLSIGCKYVVFPIVMLLLLNFFVRWIPIKGIWIEKMSSYGMGIYLYAEPLNYLLLYFFYTVCGVNFWGTNGGAAIIYFSRVFITPIIAIGITWALKKLNLKYLY